MLFVDVRESHRKRQEGTPKPTSTKYSHNRSLPVLGKQSFPVITQMLQILACHVLLSRGMG